MADNNDNSKRPESTSKSSQHDKTQVAKKSVKKERFKFQKEDMSEITYNFQSLGRYCPPYYLAHFIKSHS